MGASTGDDTIAYFAADIEETRELTLSTSSAQTSDADGPLMPGRYLIQLRDTEPTAWVWVKVGKFEKGSTITAAAEPGRNIVPLSRQGLIAFEFNAVEGESDRIAAITESGGGTLYMTLVSRARGEGT